jgi:hypothetical protein
MSSFASRIKRRLRQRFPVPEEWDTVKRTHMIIALRKSMIAIALWMLALTVVLLLITAAQDSKFSATQHRSYISCIRSQTIAPSLSRFYRHEHALVGKALRIYIETIPKSC